MNKRISIGRLPKLPDDGTPEEFYCFLKQSVQKKQSLRLCSKTYSEFRFHSFFDGIDWVTFEQGDIDIRCEAVAENMVCVDEENQVYSPKPPDLGEDVVPPNLADLAPATDVCKLFTFSAPGFQRAMQAVKSGNVSSAADEIDDEFEVPDEEGWRGKLPEYAQDISSVSEPKEAEVPAPAQPAQ